MEYTARGLLVYPPGTEGRGQICILSLPYSGAPIYAREQLYHTSGTLIFVAKGTYIHGSQGMVDYHPQGYAYQEREDSNKTRNEGGETDATKI